MKKYVLGLLVLLFSIVLTACNFADDDVNTDERVDVSITDKHGTRTVKTNPKKVAFLSLDSLDMLDNVGFEKTAITKVGMIFKGSASYLSKYNNDANVVDLGTHVWETGFHLDELKLLNPELIILGNRTTSWYDRLKEAFPTTDIYDASHDISTGKVLETIEKNVIAFEAIFVGLDKSLTTKLNQYKVQINDIKALVATKKLYFLSSSAKSFTAYGNPGRFATLFIDFGFISAYISETTDPHGDIINYEHIASSKPDVILVLDQALAQSGTTTANIGEIKANDLIKGTEAGKNGNIFLVDTQAWYLVQGGFTALEKQINDVNQYVSKLK